MTDRLICPSCGRVEGDGPGEIIPFDFQDRRWCPFCTHFGTSYDGLKFVKHPSPGALIEKKYDSIFNSIQDCFVLKPKKRILKKNARLEILRLWSERVCNKQNHAQKMIFYNWLNCNRPYLLTFRCNFDRWQQVQAWLNSDD